MSDDKKDLFAEAIRKFQSGEIRFVNPIEEQLRKMREADENNHKMIVAAAKERHRREMEQIARAERTNELLAQLVANAGKIELSGPELVNIITGNIDTLQQVTGRATGYQIVDKKQGFQLAELLQAIVLLRETFELLPEEQKQEAEEIAEELEKQIQSEEPKKGPIKRLGAGLLELVKGGLKNPVTVVEGADKLMQKAPELADHFEKMMQAFT